MNIAEFCFKKRVVTLALTAVVTIAGVLSYFRLGRLEDPEFTIRCAQVVTTYPGASAEEVADRVTDPIETEVQRLGQVKHVTSTSYPGRSIVLVEIDDSYMGDELPQIWDELRRKVGDAAGKLPQGCGTPVVCDDYGDVYGVYYAVYGDGYDYRDLKQYAKLLRRELLQCSEVAKVDLLGDQSEIVSIEMSRAKLAALNVTPEQIADALTGQNVPFDATAVQRGDKRIAIRPCGGFSRVEELGALLVTKDVRLRDVAEVRRDYAAPPKVLVRRNGHPCITLGISTKKGGNVVTMGDAVDKRLGELKSTTPMGIEIDAIAHQARSVVESVNGFIVNLVESVVLVIAVLLITMGLRSGLLIGGVLLITVLATVFAMDLCGILFERISLGAFIIALGMLVDNAIVITEAVLIAAQKGESKKDAAIAVVRQTQWALLGGTAIATLSFAPIGACQNSTGEYCRSLFLVIGISLLISWVMALTVTPLLAAGFLKSKVLTAGTAGDSAAADPYGGRFFGYYRRFLEWCIDNRFFVAFALICMFVASVAGFKYVDKIFFPESTRNQFLVHVWMPEGTRIEHTDEVLQKVAGKLREYPGVTGVSTFSGQGAMRFLLTYTPEDGDSAYGLAIVDTETDKTIGGLMASIEADAPALVPDAEVSGQRFVLGPGDPYRIQFRITGPDLRKLRQFGDQALEIMRADGGLKEIRTSWRNRADLIVPVVSDTRTRKLGLNRSDVSAAFAGSNEGLTLGVFQEKDEQLPIMLRSPKSERDDPSGLLSAWAWSAARRVAVPVVELIDDLKRSSEEMRIDRRERRGCITVKCNPKGDETADSALQRIKPLLDQLGAGFPPGYACEWGGEFEDSNEANSRLATSFAPILAMMVLVVIMLFNSIKKTLVIYLTLPLVLVGVVGGLLLFGKPFGFMALLGTLSLVGMQVKNAIVLMDEISARQDAGDTPFAAIVSAGVSRLRPVFNSSITTVLGMLPLVTDAFYSAMAVAIMIGLSFSTVLTMVIIPVNYAIIFKVRRS